MWHLVDSIVATLLRLLPFLCRSRRYLFTQVRSVIFCVIGHPKDKRTHKYTHTHIYVCTYIWSPTYRIGYYETQASPCLPFSPVYMGHSVVRVKSLWPSGAILRLGCLTALVQVMAIAWRQFITWTNVDLSQWEIIQAMQPTQSSIGCPIFSIFIQSTVEWPVSKPAINRAMVQSNKSMATQDRLFTGAPFNQLDWLYSQDGLVIISMNMCGMKLIIYFQTSTM